MKPVVFKFSGVTFAVENEGTFVTIDSDGNLNFDGASSPSDSITWPKPIQYNKADTLGGFERGQVARDIIPQNFPIGEVRKVHANNDSTIRNAAYRYDMKLKISLAQVKRGNKPVFNVTRTA
jgi:hypothetical protein